MPFCLLLALAGCSNKKSTGTSVPAGAAVLQAYMQQGVARLFPALNGVDAVLPLLGNPGAPGSEGLQFAPDPSPGAPPHAYVFQLPLDGDLDGASGGVMTGRCRLSDDPANARIGFGGTIELNASLAGGLGTLAANFQFELTAQGTRLVGTGTFAEMVSNTSTDIAVTEEAPLYLKQATGEPGSVGNACAYSLDGPVAVGVESGESSLSSRWVFSSSSRDVAVTGGTYSDGQHDETPLPDASYRVPCGDATLARWAGVYEQTWDCLPAETGNSRLTLTVASATSLHIVDEDPPGSGQTKQYDATVVSGNPGVVHGFFIGGEPGATYREDFTWTLAPDYQGFTQVSVYRYEAGGTGPGGLCAARAHRVN